MDNPVSLQTVLSNSLPGFVQDSYPQFVAFLQAYSTFLEQSQAPINTIADIDTTLDSFLSHYRAETNYLGTVFPEVNERFLIKHIKDLYACKGTSESFKLLFRLLFNKDVNIIYPESQCLKTSDGKWDQKFSIFIKDTRTQTPAQGLTCAQTTAYITSIDANGNSRKIRIEVQDIIQRDVNAYEMFILNNYYGSFKVGDSFICGNYSGTVIPTIVGYKIIVPGVGFRLGQNFQINTFLGKGTQIKVTGVDSNSGISQIQFVKVGFGYLSDFNISDLTAPNLSTVTLAEGFSGNSGQFNELISVNPDGGAILNLNYDHNYEYDYAGQIVGEFYNAAGGVDPNRCSITFLTGPVCKYPGQFLNSDGFLSDQIKLQDSKVYQKFSYIIQVDELLSAYADIVKSYVHPAGMYMIGEYDIQNTFNAKLVLSSLFARFNISHADSISTTDFEKFWFNTNKSDSVSNSDHEAFNLQNVQSDIMDAMTDFEAFNLQNVQSDILSSPTDVKNWVYSKLQSDASTQVDMESFNLQNVQSDIMDAMIDFEQFWFNSDPSDSVSFIDSDSNMFSLVNNQNEYATCTDYEAFDLQNVQSDLMDAMIDYYQIAFNGARIYNDTSVVIDINSFILSNVQSDVMDPMTDAGTVDFNREYDPTTGNPTYVGTTYIF